MIKTMISATVALGVLAGIPTTLFAQTLVDDVRRSCKTEIRTYCGDVTPGEGRILACFYAHGTKLSPPCEYALFNASARLAHAIAAVAYVAKECNKEIDTHCSSIQSSGGRIAQCLFKNESSLGKSCDQALSDVGAK